MTCWASLQSLIEHPPVLQILVRMIKHWPGADARRFVTQPSFEGRIGGVPPAHPDKDRNNSTHQGKSRQPAGLEDTLPKIATDSLPREVHSMAIGQASFARQTELWQTGVISHGMHKVFLGSIESSHARVVSFRRSETVPPSQHTQKMLASRSGFLLQKKLLIKIYVVIQ